MPLFDEVKKNLIEWYTVTSEKTTEVARVTSRRYDKFGISRDIERQFSELGSVVYNGLQAGRDDVLSDEVVRTLVERLDRLESELQAKDAEIEQIKRTYGDRKAAAASAGVGGDVAMDSAAEADVAEADFETLDVDTESDVTVEDALDEERPEP